MTANKVIFSKFPLRSKKFLALLKFHLNLLLSMVARTFIFLIDFSSYCSNKVTLSKKYKGSSMREYLICVLPTITHGLWILAYSCHQKRNLWKLYLYIGFFIKNIQWGIQISNCSDFGPVYRCSLFHGPQAFYSNQPST